MKAALGFLIASATLLAYYFSPLFTGHNSPTWTIPNRWITIASRPANPSPIQLGLKLIKLTASCDECGLNKVPSTPAVKAVTCGPLNRRSIPNRFIDRLQLNQVKGLLSLDAQFWQQCPCAICSLDRGDFPIELIAPSLFQVDFGTSPTEEPEQHLDGFRFTHADRNASAECPATITRCAIASSSLVNTDTSFAIDDASGIGQLLRSHTKKDEAGTEFRYASEVLREPVGALA